VTGPTAHNIDGVSITERGGVEAVDVFNSDFENGLEGYTVFTANSILITVESDPALTYEGNSVKVSVNSPGTTLNGPAVLSFSPSFDRLATAATLSLVTKGNCSGLKAWFDGGSFNFPSFYSLPNGWLQAVVTLPIPSTAPTSIKFGFHFASYDVVCSHFFDNITLVEIIGPEQPQIVGA
jgi:hypothetical protein